LKKELKKLGGDVLVLEGLGSITDPKEFDQEVFKKILKLAIDKGDFKTITIETHITQINEELVSYIDSINNSKKRIMFEIGVEDMSAENRKLINKLGVENNKIKEVYEMLLKHNIDLDINLIYGFPFMNEEERINSVIDSLRKINRDLPKAEATLFLMSSKENTIMDYMRRKGVYKPPNPWGFVELTKRILDNEELKDILPPTYAWFGEKEFEIVKNKTCYTCPNCKERIIETFRNINGTFDNKERRRFLQDLIDGNEDNCYQEFLETLESEKDGKTPKERYRDFINDIAEKGINYDLR